MKKLLFGIAVMCAMCVTSCGNKSKEVKSEITTETDTTIVDTTSVDTTTVDTTVVS